MNNQVMPFNFKGRQVRTVMIDNVPYFLGNDVAKLLGYKRIGDALKNHIEPYERKTLTYKGFGDLAKPLWNKNDYANKTLIKESGMISLVFGSNLPQAKEFKRWATEEVLPEVMRTGSYQLNKAKQLSATEQLKLATQSVGELDDRVSNLENTMEITSNDEFKLKRVGQNKALTVLGGKSSEAYKKIGRKVFSQMWRDFKNNFVIPRYSSLPKKRLEEGIAYLNNWQPDEILDYAIQGLNKQEVKA